MYWTFFFLMYSDVLGSWYSIIFIKYHIILLYTILCYVTFYHIILCYIILLYTILYFIILYIPDTLIESYYGANETFWMNAIAGNTSVLMHQWWQIFRRSWQLQQLRLLVAWHFGQIIAISAEVTPNSGLIGKSSQKKPLYNSGLGNVWNYSNLPRYNVSICTQSRMVSQAPILSKFWGPLPCTREKDTKEIYTVRQKETRWKKLHDVKSDNTRASFWRQR